MTQAEYLYETVIKNQYCIGCGACTAFPNSPFSVDFDSYGNLEAKVKNFSLLEDVEDKYLEICPFSDRAKNEDVIGKMYYPNVGNYDEKLGHFDIAYAGYVKVDGFREHGSSGGFAKWILHTLMEDKYVDAVVQVTPTNGHKAGGELFEYSITTNPSDIKNGSTSCYYPTTLSDVLKFIRSNNMKFAITGVPCFIKALRLLSIQDSIFAERIEFAVGIFCGGMKSANHSKLIGWDMGIIPKDLVKIDFRKKSKNMPASKKIYQAFSKNDRSGRYKEGDDILGTGWNGYFTPKPCDYCDDVVGETADISCGDAWLPEYENDPRGTSIIIIRNEIINHIITEKLNKGDIFLENISAERVIKSQEGGFRHRREALSLRLQEKVNKGLWHPPKRIQPGQYSINKNRRKIYRLRVVIAKKSHVYFRKALQLEDLKYFNKNMLPIEKKYWRLVRGSLLVRITRKVRRILDSSFGRITQLIKQKEYKS